MSLLDGLSAMQKKAVESIDNDLEIIACAGAGKTGVVTRRIVNILKSKPDVLPVFQIYSNGILSRGTFVKFLYKTRCSQYYDGTSGKGT